MESWCRSEVKWKLFKKFSRTVAVKFSTTEITIIGIITQLKLKKKDLNYTVTIWSKMTQRLMTEDLTEIELKKLISYLDLITFKKCPLLLKFVLFFEA